MKFQDLQNWLIDPKSSDQEKSGKEKFVKSAVEGSITTLNSIGKSNPLLRKKANEFYKTNKSLDVMDLMEKLESIRKESNLIEAWVLSTYILGKYKNQFDLEVWNRLHTWINDVDQWISADHLCIDVFCHFPVYKEPYYSILHEEVTSDNFWRRRIAVVRFIKHVRVIPEAVEKLLPIMDKILEDANYYVRKAIPWLLRESSKSAPALIKRYLSENKDKMKSSEIKEASKYLS